VEFVRLDANNNTQVLKEFGVEGTPAMLLVSGSDNGSKYSFQTFKGLTGEDTLRQVLNEAVGGSISGLLGYWKLDDGGGTTARDSSGQGNHGTVKGNPSWINWEASGTTGNLTGAVLHFDGTSTYVLTPVQFSQLSTGMTWMAWAKHDDRSMGWSWLFSEDSGEDNYSQIGKAPNTGEVRFELQGVGTIDTSGVNIADGQSHHIAGVWEKGVGLKIYVDGALKASGNFTGSLSAKKAIRIGSKNDGYAAEKWKGTIGGACIVNRALTSSEIQSAMNGNIAPNPTATPTSTSTGSTSGLVAYYPFDGDYGDRSGNGNNGTAKGSMSFTTGVIGQGAKFDGKSWIEVNDSPSLDLSTAFTFSAWLNEADAGAGGWGTVLSKGDTSALDNSSPYAFDHTPDGLYPSVRMTKDNSYTNVDSTSRTDFNKWYLISATWDGQNVKFYIDGVLTDTKPWQGTLPNSTAKLIIGSDPPGATEYFNGVIDDLRIYNRALSANEIATLKSGASMPPVSTPTPTTSPTPSASGTATVSLSWIDFGQDKVDRYVSKPNNTPDGHFRVNLNVSGSKTVDRITLYTSDSSGNPVDIWVWNSGPGANWILGVFRNGVNINPDYKLLNDPVSGQVTYDVFGDDDGVFKPGRFFGITVLFTDGTSVKGVTSIPGSTPTPTPTPAASPTSTPSTSGTASLALSWVDFGQDKMDRSVSKPNTLPDGHFRVDLNGSKSVQRMLLYTSDQAGNPALGQFWDSAPNTNASWILGVFRNGTVLNTQPSILNDPVGGQASYDVFSDNSGYFKAGQFFGITVYFTDGTLVKGVTSIPTSGSTVTPTPTSTQTPTGPGNIPGSATSPPPFGDPQPNTNVQRMSIQVAQRRVIAGELVQVPVWLVTSNNVANINFELSFNAAVAKSEGSIPKGNLLDNSLFSSNANDAGIIRAGFAGTGGVSGTGTVMTVPFRAIGKPGDRTLINVSVTTINDPAGKVLTIDRIPGEIVILNPDGTLPGTTGTSTTGGVPPGDCDGDGVLTFLDAVCALEMSVKLQPARMLLDIDKSGDVTSRDATLIAQKVVGKP
jgi:hypothetical protein